jgi:signal peptidase I
VFGDIKDWVLSLMGKGLRYQLQDASALVKRAQQSAEAIRRDLDMALDLVNKLRKATDENKVKILDRYKAVMASIDRNAEASQHGGHSLIDRSNYERLISEAGTVNWMRKLDHICLTVDDEGLDLPKLSDLDNRAVLCDDAQKRLAGSVKRINKAISQFEGHLKAIEARQKRFDDEGASDAVAMPDEAKDSLLEIAQIVVVALVIAIVFRSFLFQPFHIPSGSMKPTLLKGDYLFVSKFSYGFSHKSFPFGIDFFEGRVFHREPKRGDVIVFKLTSDGRTDYIKRLIGLPGDKIQVTGGVLFINDKPVPKEEAGDYFYTDDTTHEQFAVRRHRETLPNGVIHNTLDLNPIGRNDNTSIYRVPDGYYFFMGDNRDNSQDSRVIGGGVGFVPAENLIGRAELIFISVDGSAQLWQIWKWPGAIRYSRLFKKIR